MLLTCERKKKKAREKVRKGEKVRALFYKETLASPRAAIFMPRTQTKYTPTHFSGLHKRLRPGLLTDTAR